MSNLIKFTSINLCLAVAVNFSLVHSWPAFAKGASQKKQTQSKNNKLGWVFDIVTDRGGHQSMYLTEDKVRFKHKSLTVVMVAPKFDATIYNTATQKYTTIPYKAWMTRYNRSDTRKITPIGKPKKVLGFKTQAYRSPMKSRGLVKELWMTDEPQLSKEVKQFICNTISVPQGKGIPLKIMVHRRGNTTQVHWNVVGYKRKKIKDSLFSIPAGYKQVKSEMELLVNDNDADGMADLLR